MKTNRTKSQKIKPITSTSTPATRGRRARCAHKPHPGLYEVVLFVDTLAARNLYNRPPDVHQLFISPGPEDDCFLVRATASATQLLKLAAWAAAMEPNVTVRSPASLRTVVRIMSTNLAADIVTLSA